MVFEFEYNGILQRLEVSPTTVIKGVKPTNYHMYLNKHFIGEIWLANGKEWRYWMHNRDFIFASDIDIIIEMIKNNEIT